MQAVGVAMRQRRLGMEVQQELVARGPSAAAAVRILRRPCGARARQQVQAPGNARHSGTRKQARSGRMEQRRRRGRILRQG
jgi:hypothetical protein